MPNMPPKANRRWKTCISPALYRGRNAIERGALSLADQPIALVVDGIPHVRHPDRATSELFVS
jgi:hypothetical protein